MLTKGKIAATAGAAGALALAGCSSDGGDDGNGDTDASGDDAYKIGINQLVQHPALDAVRDVDEARPDVLERDPVQA